MARVLVVDDEAGICRAFARYLEGRDHVPLTAATAEAGLEIAAQERPAVILLDVRLPGMDGLEALARFRKTSPESAVIVITAQGTVETAVRAMRDGAFEYLTKPIDLDRAGLVIDRALERVALSGEVARLREELAARGPTGLVGNTPIMQEVYKRIGAVSRSDATVLVAGESGTGKELVAHAIHDASPRAAAAFEPINCAALPETLLHSELFGHEKGAFTGAVERTRGKFERADGGTVFLDEIGEMPAPIQTVLLRFLEEHRFERLGGEETIDVDVRILAATHADLAALVRDGDFREDLYYRLRVVEIRLPPLRDRLEDVPILVASFLNRAQESGGITDEAMEALGRHAWPGNVRELKNAIEHAMVLAGAGPIRPEHLPDAVRRGAPAAAHDDRTVRDLVTRWVNAEAGSDDLFERVEDRWRAPLVAEALARTEGNQVQASKLLGIHRTTLRNLIARYGLGTPRGNGT